MLKAIMIVAGLMSFAAATADFAQARTCTTHCSGYGNTRTCTTTCYWSS